MTAQKSLRKKFSSLLATGTVALLAASGIALAPTAAFADEPVVPTVTVSQTTGIDPDGQTVTVTGSGFLPHAPETTGTRPPLSGKFGGSYIVFGSFLETWQPSLGSTVAPSSSRKVLHGQQKWAVLAEDFGGGVNAGNGGIIVDAEGNFTTELTLKKDDAAALENGRYGIYTYSGSGAAYSGFETYTPITFSDPAVPANVSASVTDATTSGLKVQASASDIVLQSDPLKNDNNKPDNGVYLAVIEKGTAGDLSLSDQGLAATWVPGAQMTGDSAQAALEVAASKLDRTKQYEVVVWRAHGLYTSLRALGSADINVTEAQWDKVFPKPVDPKPVSFTDVKKGDKFYTEIAWMASEGISTGVKQANGTFQYQPKNNVTREAMAAFLYRQYGEKNFKAPAKSPFTDVKPGDKFYKEIAWMAAEGISTGVKQANGTVKFQPKSGITREAMAAFMFRIDTTKKPAAPAVSPFADVKKGDKFYKEIAWMSQSGLSTGIKQSSGKPVYAPKSNVTREAMAAFLYRAAK